MGLNHTSSRDGIFLLASWMEMVKKTTSCYIQDIGFIVFSLSIGDVQHGPKLLTCTSTAHPPAGSLCKNDKKNCWRQNERPSTCLLNLLILIRGYLLTKGLKLHKLYSRLSKSCDPHSIFSQSSDFPTNKHQKKKEVTSVGLVPVWMQVMRWNYINHNPLWKRISNHKSA